MKDVTMVVEQKLFDERIAKIVDALVVAGYDPIAQLIGYVQTDDDTFITRTGNARAIIRTLDKSQIATYVEKNKNC